MKKKVSIGLSIVASGLLVLAGCGSSSNNDTPATPAAVASGTAFYVDSAVEGITVTCGDLVSVTDKQGAFGYIDGQSCTFAIAGVMLREQAGIVDGQNVLEDNIAVARLLQSLDNDNDPSNGITITPEVLKVMSDNGIVTLPTTDEEVADLVVKLQQAGINYGGDVVSPEKAKEHLDGTKKELSASGAVTSATADNKAPVAVAGDDFTIESGETVNLDGSKSSDPDGSIASYNWVRLGNEGNPRDTVKTDVAQLPDGEYTFILTVTDDQGATAKDEVKVKIESSIPSSVLEAFGGKTLYAYSTYSSDVDRITKYVWNANATHVTVYYSEGYTREYDIKLIGSDDFIVTFDNQPHENKIIKYDKECFLADDYVSNGSGDAYELTDKLRGDPRTYCYSEADAKKHPHRD